MGAMDNRDVMLLSAYLDDELTVEERIQFEERLQSDSQLQAELDELRQTIAFIQQMPLLKAPRNYTLNPAEFQPRTRPMIYRLRPVLAVAAALVMVCGAVFFFMSLQSSDEASESQSVDIAAAPTEQAMPTFAMTQAAQEPDRALDEADREFGAAAAPSELKGTTEQAEEAAMAMITATPLATPTLDLLAAPSGGGGLVEPNTAGEGEAMPEVVPQPPTTFNYLDDTQGQILDTFNQIWLALQQLIDSIRRFLP